MKTEILPSAEDVAARASELILEAADAAIDRRGAFSLVLAGGTTPAACYRQLSTVKADWHRWHIYFGDERCLDPGDSQRNSVMAAQLLTERVPIPCGQVHPIHAERGPDAAARDYEATIQSALPFDLVILGMGEDGHTASLFPGHQHPTDWLVLPVHDAPKPPPERVSLGAPAIESCAQLLVLVTGTGKRPAMQQWREGEDLPIARLARGGHTTVLLDKAANPDAPVT